MANFTDATRVNGWIPEPVDGEVLQRALSDSVVSQVARKVNMTSDNLRVPRFDSEGVDIVAQRGTIPLRDGVLDTVLLEASKWSTRYSISIEDERDAIKDILNLHKTRWASEFAISLDNACFGVTGAVAAPGTNVPFESVYAAADAVGNVKEIGVTGTPAPLKYEDLVEVFADVEDSNYPDGIVVVAHPSFGMQLRNLKDAAGNRVVTDPLGAGVPTIFGKELRFSRGLRTSATASHKPTGNPLLVVGPRDHMILGERDGIESSLSNEARWETDEVELKMRARRAFTVATPDAFHVLEKVA